MAESHVINKCNFKCNELIEKELDLSPYRTWLNSFINNPYPRVEANQQLIQQNYLSYAGTCFFKFAEKDFNHKSLELPLKAWNIFIHNISTAYPAYLEEKIVPLLKGFSVKRLEELFRESNLSNIGIFLNSFNPQDGIFKWAIPAGIDFRQINFLKKFEDSTPEAISHFLFNFYYINRGDCGNYFAEQLDSNYLLIIPKIRDASIAELDFFFWNLWMAMPKGEKPLIFIDEIVSKLIFDKAMKEKKDKESILGLIGTLNLSMSSVKKELIELINSTLSDFAGGRKEEILLQGSKF